MRIPSIKNIFFHCIFWIVFTLLLSISRWGPDLNLNESFIYEIIYLPIRVIAVYVNAALLLPHLIEEKKRFRYACWLTLLLVVATFAHRTFALFWAIPNYLPRIYEPEHIDVFNIPRLLQMAILITLPVILSSAYIVIIHLFKIKAVSERLEKEKIKTELDFLKSQTNPHFLFNTLNIVYGYALEKSVKTPKLILKLSEILRYTLYDTHKNLVAVEKEVQLIEDMISFQKERFKKRINLTLVKKFKLRNFQLPPLILIPLVENAFKYGRPNNKDEHFIDIQMNNSSDTFFFKIENTHNNNSTKEDSGLGLSNIKRRLDLVYGNHYNLNIMDSPNLFVVELTLPIR